MLVSLLPWLMLNRDGLTILLHRGTGNDYADHSEHASGSAPCWRRDWMS